MAAAQPDPALETLLLPFVGGQLPWPEAGGALFLRARDGWPLHQRPLPGLVCEQSFRPDAEALQRAGVAMVEAGDTATYPLVLVLPPRQRDEARALFARAIAHTAARRSRGRLRHQQRRRAFGRGRPAQGRRPGRQPDQAQVPGVLDRAIAGPGRRRRWPRSGWRWTRCGRSATAASSAARACSPGTASTRPRRCWPRTCRSTSPAAPPTSAPASATCRCNCSRTAPASPRSTCTRPRRVRSTSRAATWPRSRPRPRSATTGTTSPPACRPQYDVIVSNPPFHTQSRADRPDIGRRFIAVAAEALKPGGRLWLVANRHLPYEAVLTRELRRGARGHPARRLQGGRGDQGAADQAGAATEAVQQGRAAEDGPMSGFATGRGAP